MGTPMTQEISNVPWLAKSETDQVQQLHHVAEGKPAGARFFLGISHGDLTNKDIGKP